MAAPADYLDTVDLKAVDAGGLVNEDVLQKIFDISELPTPFMDMVMSDSCKNSYTEWVTDELGAVDVDNAVISGADASGYETAGGARVGNHTQISDKVIAVTERVRNTDNVGRSDELAYQVARGLQKLRRDVEAIALTNQASVADNNNNVAGKSAGLGAWIATNSQSGSGGSATGFNTTTKVVDAPTVGTTRALTFVMLRDAIEDVYLENGNPTTVMSRPELIKRLASYLFTTDYAAVPTSNVGGTAPATQVSQGFINVMRTDFGFTLALVPNRLQQKYDSADVSTDLDAVNLYLIDPSMVALAYLDGYKVKELAKLGLSDRRHITVDWTLKVYQEKALAVIRDLLPTSAVTAS